MIQIQKKGDVHIDWVISIGIFLTFVIVLLAFIKPGYEPNYEGEVLINIVENELMERSEWKVGRALLNVNCENSGIVKFNIKDYVPEANNFKILNKNFEPATSFYSTSDGFKLKVNSGVNQYYVVYSDSSYPSGTLEGIPNVECNAAAANPIIVRGIKKENLNLGDLKLDKWDYPEFRHFRVMVLDSEGKSKNYCFAKGSISGSDCEQIKIPEQIRIFAADKGAFFLDQNMVKEQVILNILVW